jgi:microcompartment protein CcmK/EutM
MIIAKVMGSVVSTIKHGSYQNKKLMLVKPISPDQKEEKGAIAAVDLVGAGKGDVVLVASEGRAAQDLLNLQSRAPIRSIIVGIIDDTDHGDS